MKAWTKATSEAWAITQPALENILEIAARQNQSPEVVAAQLGKNLQNNFSVNNDNGTAVIPVVGPLFRYANMLTQVSGASSYELITTAFCQMQLKTDPLLKLNFDPPKHKKNGKKNRYMVGSKVQLYCHCDASLNLQLSEPVSMI